jgi:hypothetical protein
MAVPITRSIHAARSLAGDGVQLRHLLQDGTKISAIVQNNEERIAWNHLQWRSRLAL